MIAKSIRETESHYISLSAQQKKHSHILLLKKEKLEKLKAESQFMDIENEKLVVERLRIEKIIRAENKRKKELVCSYQNQISLAKTEAAFLEAKRIENASKERLLMTDVSNMLYS